MKAATTAVAVSLLLVACASEAPRQARAIPGFTVASWLTGARGDTVRVAASHSSYDHVIERVELVAPGGRVYAPVKISWDSGHQRKGPGLLDRKSLRVKSGKGWGMGGAVRVNPGQVAGRDVRVDVRGGSKGRVGVGVRVPFRKSKSRTPRFETRAVFHLDDPAAYRRAVGRWRIRIHVTHAVSGLRTIIQPAPRPEG